MKDRSSDGGNTRLILVTETLGNRISAISKELSGLIRPLCGEAAISACFVVLGCDIMDKAEELAEETGIPVVAFQGDLFGHPDPGAVSDAVCALVQKSNPDYICFLHTACGCHAAAETAVKLGAPCITGIEGIATGGDSPLFERSIFNGAARMALSAKGSPVVLTVLPGAFKPPETALDLGARSEVTSMDPPAKRPGFTPIGVETELNRGDTALEHADIIIAVGRGIGDKENLAVAEQLASLLPNAAVAASRPLCDIGWMPYSRQVGATGKTVSPKLYMACGISGAQQHVYGMKDSRCIVAVNTDPNAAIFQVADYCIVDDILTFLPALTEAYKNMTHG